MPKCIEQNIGTEVKVLGIMGKILSIIGGSLTVLYYQRYNAMGRTSDNQHISVEQLLHKTV